MKMGSAEKLIFPLCLKCAENKFAECNYNESERAFTGTWSTVEVAEALEKGYKIVNIYEVWHFEANNNILNFKDYISLSSLLEPTAH